MREQWNLRKFRANEMKNLTLKRTHLEVEIKGGITELARDAVKVFWFLIPTNTTVTIDEFATLIGGYSQHPKAKEIIAHLRAT